ncbi:MAG TPA: hypothetical protein VER12_13515 [Polyangiaceae bacterium]|nr:hypothetical protein [Polyangiaceae bacterium]
MSPRYSTLLLASSLALLLGCSASSSDTSPIGRPPNGQGGNGSVLGGGGGTSIITGPDGSAAQTTFDPNDKRDIPMREKACDAAGNCTCLRLAMLGTLTSAANDPDTTAFTTWLSEKSDGTAVATNIPTKPTIDAGFLASYDILLVANVNGWMISASEKAAVEKWVSEGGGIITLTGFTSNATEAAATSQLISFAGLSYTGTSEAQWAAPKSGEQQPVYYKGGNVDLKLCMNWDGVVSNAAKPFITTPIKFPPQTGSLAKLTANLDYTGAFIGWPIMAPADATVIAKDPVTGGNMAVAKEVNGKGRIFAFGDEWVTFTSLWQQSGMPVPPQKDAGNKCWVPDATLPEGGFFHSVGTLYQTKQFWYNAINWVAPPNQCFTLKDPDVITVVK